MPRMPLGPVRPIPSIHVEPVAAVRGPAPVGAAGSPQAADGIERAVSGARVASSTAERAHHPGAVRGRLVDVDA